jgi:hypothetical protein
MNIIVDLKKGEELFDTFGADLKGLEGKVIGIFNDEAAKAAPVLKEIGTILSGALPAIKAAIPAATEAQIIAEATSFLKGLAVLGNFGLNDAELASIVGMVITGL